MHRVGETSAPHGLREQTIGRGGVKGKALGRRRGEKHGRAEGMTRRKDLKQWKEFRIF
jgi:hypothetical protein